MLGCGDGEGAGVGAGAGVGEGAGAGVGEGALGVGAGVEDGAGVDAGLLGFATFFFFLGFFCAGSEPDVLYEVKVGGGATFAGVTADGAAVVLVPPLALPIPNAAPNATSAATTPMAMSFPEVMCTLSLASCCPASCSG